MPGIDINQLVTILSVALIPGLFAITLHEVSHGWAAKRLGDPTAFMLGRLSLNPIKHIDPFGTVIVPLTMLLFSGGQMAFGWAKPVPVAFGNLRNPRRDMVLVAAAGPGSNLLMASFWAALGFLLLNVVHVSGIVGAWLVGMCVFGIQINVLLAVFNMVPIPPLDGGRVLTGLLPPPMARMLENVEPYGFIIVILLVMVPPRPLLAVIEPVYLELIRFFWIAGGLE